MDSQPYVLAMVLADLVHRDSISGKCTIVGTFENITVKKFPHIQRRMGIYLALTNGRGASPLSIRLVNLREDEVIKSVDAGTVHFGSPLEVKELVFDLTGATFPEEGVYCWQVFLRSDMLAERRLKVTRDFLSTDSSEGI